MKDKRFLANVDKDALCFAVAVLIMMGIGGTVAWDVNKEFTKPHEKKESVIDTIKAQRDTVVVRRVNIMDLISTKQK